jgi:hypothetical protein
MVHRRGTTNENGNLTWVEVGFAQKFEGLEVGLDRTADSGPRKFDRNSYIGYCSVDLVPPVMVVLTRGAMRFED